MTYHQHIALAAGRRPALARGETELRFLFDGFDLIVRGDYQPREHAIIDNRTGVFEPGCPEDFEVAAVYLADSAIDALELFDASALRIAVLEEIDDRARRGAEEQRAA